MFVNVLLIVTVFSSFNELDSLKEKIKPKLFLDINEIIDYPVNGLFFQSIEKGSKKKQTQKNSSKRKKGNSNNLRRE